MNQERKFKMTEINLIERQDLRDQVAGRVEVLDKVKKLFLIPGMNVMTIQQVADYYEVDYESIRTAYKRNRDEINTDGAWLKKQKEFLTVQNEPLEIATGYGLLKLSNDVVLKIPNRGVRVFSKRAVLRIGMLLRDSQVAKEVRTQLLNVFEKTSTNQKVEEIEKENKLLMDFAVAFRDGNKLDMAEAAQELIQYQYRHINALKKENLLLAKDILVWEDRAKFNMAVRTIAGIIQEDYGSVYSEIYRQLKYKYGIDLKRRNGGHRPFIENIKKDEWIKVQKILVALANEYKIDIRRLFETVKLNAQNTPKA